MKPLNEILTELREYQRRKINDPDYSSHICDALNCLEDAVADEKSFDWENYRSEMSIAEQEHNNDIRNER